MVQLPKLEAQSVKNVQTKHNRDEEAPNALSGHDFITVGVDLHLRVVYIAFEQLFHLSYP